MSGFCKPAFCRSDDNSNAKLHLPIKWLDIHAPTHIYIHGWLWIQYDQCDAWQMSNSSISSQGLIYCIEVTYYVNRISSTMIAARAGNWHFFGCAMSWRFTTMCSQARLNIWPNHNGMLTDRADEELSACVCSLVTTKNPLERECLITQATFAQAWVTVHEIAERWGCCM